MTTLFSSLQLGRYTLANRVLMAPMTRSRAHDDGVPSTLAIDYYRQRAGAGLIISEGVAPSAMGKGYRNIPGVYTDAQVESWRRIVRAVHAAGGRMFMQLMHTGRIAHPSLLPEGAAPVAPSAIAARGTIHTLNGMAEFGAPRALSSAEVERVIEEYREATRRALDAGCDGVELHAASGYLPEQFLSSSTNQRTDEWGGSPPNRARFILEALAAMAAEAGADRVGVKLSPEMGFNDIYDDDPVSTYTYLVDALRPLGLAYLHVALPGAPSTDYHALLRPRFSGVYLVGGGLEQLSAERLLAEGKADAAVFGKLFLCNPDLPERFRRGAALNAPVRSTFYTQGAEGYIDYPVLEPTVCVKAGS